MEYDKAHVTAGFNAAVREDLAAIGRGEEPAGIYVYAGRYGLRTTKSEWGDVHVAIGTVTEDGDGIEHVHATLMRYPSGRVGVVYHATKSVNGAAVDGAYAALKGRVIGYMGGSR